MKQTRKRKRNRRKKLRKWLKFILIAAPVIALIVVIVVFGFSLKDVQVKSDLNQFTHAEVNAWVKKAKIDNTLIFWIENKIGRSRKIDFFEQYSVKIKSPSKVFITAYEKKLQGYVKQDKVYYYFDDTGKILKASEEKMKGIPKITGLEWKDLKLYQTINAKDKKTLETLLHVTKEIDEYNYPVKRIDISKTYEITLYIKKIQVQMGKESNLDKKLRDFNDNYNNVIRYEGILNMKRVNEEGIYTLKKNKK